MCENPLKWGYKMLTTKINVKFIVSLIGMKLFSLGMKKTVFLIFFHIFAP